MNVLSSLLNWIGNKIGNVTMGTSATTLTGAIAETYNRTRGVYGKGTHTVSRFYGVYGYYGTGGSLTLCVPLSVASDVTSVSFTNLVASIRNTTGGYVIPTTTNLTQYIQSASVFSNQPIVQIRLSNTDFVATNNTPVGGEITAATMVLS